MKVFLKVLPYALFKGIVYREHLIEKVLLPSGQNKISCLLFSSFYAMSNYLRYQSYNSNNQSNYSFKNPLNFYVKPKQSG